MLYSIALGIMTRKICACSAGCNHGKPNYIVHVGNNITFFLHIFNPWVVEPADAEAADVEGRLEWCVVSHEATETESPSQFCPPRKFLSQGAHSQRRVVQEAPE